MEKYLQEFPDFDYRIPAIPGLIDTSWHNDTAPCFSSDDQFALTLWCDYASADRREIKGGNRFVLCKNDAVGTPIEDVLYTDDFGEAVKAYLVEVKKVLTGPNFFRTWIGERYKEKVGYNPFEDNPKTRSPEVVDMLAGVLAEEFKAMNEAEPEAADKGPEFPEVDEMVDAITAAEEALAEGHKNVVGNDLTEGEDCNEESAFFAALVLCRGVLAKIRAASAEITGEAAGRRAGKAMHDQMGAGRA
jgi:hypothetical protein